MQEESSIVTRARRNASGFPTNTETTYESATRSYLIEGVVYFPESVCPKPTIKYRVKYPTSEDQSTEQYGYFKSGNLMVKQVKCTTGQHFLMTSWYYDTPDEIISQSSIIYYHHIGNRYSGNDIIQEKFFTPDGEERERSKNETIETSWTRISRILCPVKYIDSIPIVSNSYESDTE